MCHVISPKKADEQEQVQQGAFTLEGPGGAVRGRGRGGGGEGLLLKEEEEEEGEERKEQEETI